MRFRSFRWIGDRAGTGFLAKLASIRYSGQGSSMRLFWCYLKLERELVKNIIIVLLLL